MIRLASDLPRRILFLLPILVSGIIAAGQASDTSVGKQTFVFRKSDEGPLQLDVFTPGQRSGPMPAIILFHGGTWISGDKSQLEWQCRFFAGRGMVAITANYRLAAGADSGRKELCIMDARSAVRWVKAHANELSVDTNRLVLGGASAGGHLATMALLNQSLNNDDEVSAPPVKAIAVVLFNPAYNVTERAAIQPFSFPKKEFPPAIMFFGSKDKWKPAADSFAVQLRGVGRLCKMVVTEGETHGFFNKSPWNRSTCEAASEFLAGLFDRRN